MLPSPRRLHGGNGVAGEPSSTGGGMGHLRGAFNGRDVSGGDGVPWSDVSAVVVGREGPGLRAVMGRPEAGKSRAGKLVTPTGETIVLLPPREDCWDVRGRGV